MARFDYRFVDRYTLMLDATRSTRDGASPNLTWDITGQPERDDVVTTVTFPGDGRYLVGLTVSDEDGRSDTTGLAFKLAPPYLHFNADPEPTIAVERDGLFATLDASATLDPDGDPVALTWFVEGELVGSGEQVHHVFPDTGRFDVSLVATDPYGGAAVAAHQVAIEALEPPHIVVDMWSGAFLDEPLFLDASGSWSDEVGPLDYWWTVEEYPEVVSNEPMLIFQPVEAGKVTVHLTVTAPSGLFDSYSDEFHVMDWWDFGSVAEEGGDSVKVSVAASAAPIDSAATTAELAATPMLQAATCLLALLGASRLRIRR